jgi:hypothetical protein
MMKYRHSIYNQLGEFVQEPVFLSSVTGIFDKAIHPASTAHWDRSILDLGSEAVKSSSQLRLM